MSVEHYLLPGHLNFKKLLSKTAEALYGKENKEIQFYIQQELT